MGKKKKATVCPSCSYYQGLAAGYQAQAEKTHSMYMELVKRQFDVLAERDALQMQVRELQGEFNGKAS